MEGLGLGENKCYFPAIAIVLIFVAALATGYYFWTRGPPERYYTISILDSNGQAVDYPELVVIGENNTFTVPVTVENHMGKTMEFDVRVKVTGQATSVFPIGSRPYILYIETLENGEKWTTNVTATIDQTGSFMVEYELWAQDEESGAFEFTDNACVLSIEAIART